MQTGSWQSSFQELSGGEIDRVAHERCGAGNRLSGWSRRGSPAFFVWWEVTPRPTHCFQHTGYRLPVNPRLSC
jgi:hypothetical protein